MHDTTLGSKVLHKNLEKLAEVRRIQRVDVHPTVATVHDEDVLQLELALQHHAGQARRRELQAAEALTPGGACDPRDYGYRVSPQDSGGVVTVYGRAGLPSYEPCA